MAFSIQYYPLFKVNIFHQYFLNEGTLEFKNMTAEKKARQLEKFDLPKIISVLPSNETILKLGGHSLVFKTGNTGFTVWSKVTGANNDEPFIELENDLNLSFVFRILDPHFYNYSDLNLTDSRKLYLFSNRKPATEPNSFPLIKKAGEPQNVDENFILSDAGEINERKSTDFHSLNNIFGIIRIYIKGDNNSLDITNAQSKIPEPFQTFEINFKNRETTWRYIFDNNQQVTGGDDVKKENGNSKILITKTGKPLTQSGFVSVELGGVELPNPDARLVKPDILTNKYYSEIYM